MFSGPEIVRLLTELGVTHVVWIPDSTMGQWEHALSQASNLQLVRVCREGEAWPLAAGLIMGGARPIVMMQITGFFESGDALRNVLYDLRIPVFAVIGLRSWLLDNSSDSARHYALPVLQAWDVATELVERHEDLPLWKRHYQSCLEQAQPGLVLLAEGKG